MKKAMILLLSVLVALSVFVSCNPEQKAPDGQTRMVQFNDGRSVSRALSRAPEGLKTEDLYWSYTAEKLDDSGFTTGQTAVKTAVGTKGLTASVGPFSQGEWKFTLYGFIDGSRSKLAWTGSTNVRLTVRDGVSAPASVSVDVHRLRTPGVKGIIRVPADLKVHDNAGNNVGTAYSLVVKVYKGEELLTFAGHTGTDYEVESGLYKVVVSAESNPGQEDDIVYASNEITVNVYDNLVTTVGGTLDETTLNTKFATNEKGETVATGMETEISQTALPTVLEVASTPTEEHATAEASTTVSIPQNSLEGSKATLSVIPYTKETVSTKPEFSIEGEQQEMLGGIDLNLSVDGKDVTTFKDNAVTVTTFIEKGLVATPVVKYNGDGPDPDPNKTTYNKETGELKFETTHFSQFLIFIGTPKAKIADKEYYSLGAAVDAATPGQTITLLDNIVFALPRTIDNDVVIDTGNFSISLLPTATLTIKQGIITGNKELFILGSGKLVIDGGTFKSNNENNYTYQTFDNGSGVAPVLEQVLFRFTGDAEVVINNGIFDFPMRVYDKEGRECLSNSNAGIGMTTPIMFFDAASASTVTINNGTFNGMLAIQPNGTLNINGGIFNNLYTLIYQRGGALNITNGEFNVTAKSLLRDEADALGYPAYDLTNMWQSIPIDEEAMGNFVCIMTEACREPVPSIKVTGGTFTVPEPTGRSLQEFVGMPTISIFLIDNGYSVDRSGMAVPYHLGDSCIMPWEGLINGNVCYIDPTQGIKVSRWNGVTTRPGTTWYDDAASEIHINTALKFVGFSNLVMNGNTFEGKTVYLDCDIDLNNGKWTPIGTTNRKATTGFFKGNFDGQDHKIMNLKPVDPNKDDSVTGLFGCVGGNGSIKNLVVESGQIVNTGDTAAGLVGFVGSAVDESFTIEKCHVKSGVTVSVPKLYEADGKESRGTVAAGVLGRAYGEGTVNVVNCTNAASVTGNSKTAGIVGACNDKVALAVTGCRNTGNITAENQNAGGILCWAQGASVNLDGCINEGVVSAKKHAGGVVGVSAWSAKHLVIKDCTSNDTVTTQNSTGNASDGKADPILGYNGSQNLTPTITP